ncbi:MAG: ATP-binding protein [Proteobacteria bacterium]|nr:ATP-binding protein [Pseudomonadota bacterium]
MFLRQVQFPPRQSFFLFGPRATGKSTLVHQRLAAGSTRFIDLLLPSVEETYARDPDLLYREVLALPDTIDTVVIDEIQKLPRLLDVVHKCLFETRRRFVLTGSSARKLRRGSANLLAGRAVERTLHPLTQHELGDAFDLESVLAWGSLPAIAALSETERADYLKAYCHGYLKEEVWGEHLIRQLDPFRKFLEVAAQHDGRTINLAAIGRDVGVDPKTVREYYHILEDTLVGFIVEPYTRSLRKRVHKAPRFLFFDLGVSRALSHQLTMAPVPGTSAYGELFERFFILEMLRREAYCSRDYRFFYLATERNEVDLVIERPGKRLAVVEVKSSLEVRPDKLRSLLALETAFTDPELFCVSRDPRPQCIGSVQALPWEMALEVL